MDEETDRFKLCDSIADGSAFEEGGHIMENGIVIPIQKHFVMRLWMYFR